MSRQVVRPGVALAVVGLLALGPAGHADAEPGSGLSSYSLSASAPGFALEGLYKDVALTVPETTSTLTTGGVGSGLAALGWPGPVIGNAGTTILVLQPAAPPQTTMLNDPVRAEARTAGPTEATYNQVPGTVMHASAKDGEVTASSLTGSGTTLPVGEVGAVSASSRVALTGATTAVATSQSSVQHLSLAGGQVEIGSVVSTASATSDGRTSSSKGSTTVTGVTVGGVPVRVDDKGLHVAGQDAADPVPVATLTDAVKALGLTMLLTEPREVRQGSSVRYVGAALVVILDQSGRQIAITLGRASASVDASAGGGTTEVLPPATGTGSGAAPAVGSAAPPAPLGTSSAPSLGAPTTTPPSLPAPVAAVVGAVAPVAALVLAAGAPVPLTLALLAGAALLALLLGSLPGRLLVAPATNCEDLS